MGMFDNVRVDHPIAGIRDPSSIEWQTKDFLDPMMDVYKITRDGRLLEELVHTEDRSDPNAEPGTLASLLGCMTRVHDGWRDMDFHGVLHFHGLLDDELVEVTAKFTDGNLVRIGRVPVLGDR